MPKNRQYSTKTHDPFAVLQYFGGSLGLHIASLIQLLLAYKHATEKIDPEVTKVVQILMTANVLSIIGIVGKLIMKKSIQNASDKQNEIIEEAKSDDKSKKALIQEAKQQIERRSTIVTAEGAEGGEEEQDDLSQKEEEEDAAKKANNLSAQIERRNDEGTLQHFSASNVLLNSTFEILPVVVFLYAIFQLICFMLVRELVEVKDEKGKVLYVDRIEVPNIKFRDQKILEDGTATDTGFVMDRFLPIFFFVLIDWLVNFVATMIFLMISFLYKFDSSQNDTIEDQDTMTQLIIFLINITLQNLTIVNGLRKSDQSLVYDIQLIEMKIDLYLVALVTLMLMLLFFKYLQSNKVFNFEEMVEELDSNPFGQFFKNLGILAMVAKFTVCLLGHPFMIAREFYYPHPEAYNFAYSWILFYFFEILVIIPLSYYMLKEILKEKFKGQKKMNLDFLGPLAAGFKKDVITEEAKDADEAEGPQISSREEQAEESVKSQLLSQITEEKILVKILLVPLYGKIAEKKKDSKHEDIQKICDMLLEKFPDLKEMIQADVELDLDQNEKENVNVSAQKTLQKFVKEALRSFDEDLLDELTNKIRDEKLEDLESDEQRQEYTELIMPIIEDVISRMDARWALDDRLEDKLDRYVRDLVKAEKEEDFSDRVRKMAELDFNTDRYENILKITKEDGSENKYAVDMGKVTEANKEFMETLYEYYEKRKKYIEKTVVADAIEFVVAMKNAQCLELHNLNYTFSLESLDDVFDLKENIKCMACFRTLDSVCQDQLSKSKSAFKTEVHCYVYCEKKKKCQQFFCDDCISQESLVSDRFLELGESVYSVSFISMMKDTNLVPARPVEDLKKISQLFRSVQIVFALQVVIFLLLVTTNWESELFQKPTPSFLIMRMVTAFMFHIYALDDSREAYQKLKFLIRYPQRFENKLRFSGYVICIEQFLITFMVEFMNLMFLCKQGNFEDLIMNYVAFAGILAIDNDMMILQIKTHKSLMEWISEPSKRSELKLYKDPKLHDKFKMTNFCYRVSFGIMKFIYKIVYFYVTPIFVIWMSFMGYDYFQQKEKKDAGYKFKFKILNLTRINENAIKDAYYGEMTNDIYQLYVLSVFFAIVMIIKQKVTDIDLDKVQRVTHFLVYVPTQVAATWLQLYLFREFWLGAYTPGWLQWAAVMPLSIGTLAAIVMISSFLFLVLVLPSDLFPVKDVLKTDGITSFIFSFLLYLITMTIFLIIMHLIYLGISIVVVLGGAAIEWICWKLYILKVVWWISAVFVYIFYIPVYIMLFAYTHLSGFLSLILVVMLLYCTKHAKKSCNDTKLNQQLLNKSE